MGEGELLMPRSSRPAWATQPDRNLLLRGDKGRGAGKQAPFLGTPRGALFSQASSAELTVRLHRAALATGCGTNTRALCSLHPLFSLKGFLGDPRLLLAGFSSLRCRRRAEMPLITRITEITSDAAKSSPGAPGSHWDLGLGS